MTIPIQGQSGLTSTILKAANIKTEAGSSNTHIIQQRPGPGGTQQLVMGNSPVMVRRIWNF